MGYCKDRVKGFPIQLVAYYNPSKTCCEAMKMRNPCLPNPENSDDHLRAILLYWNVLGRLSIVLPLLFFCIARALEAEEGGIQRNYLEWQLSKRLELVAYIWGVGIFLLLMWYGVNTMERARGFKVERLFGALFVFANLSLLCGSGILVADYTIGALRLRDFSSCIGISFIFWAVYSVVMALLLMDYQRQQELKDEQHAKLQALEQAKLQALEHIKRQAVGSASIGEQKKYRSRSLWSIIDPTYTDSEHVVEPKGDIVSSAPSDEEDTKRQVLINPSAEKPKTQRPRSLWSLIDPTYIDNEQSVEPKGDRISSTPDDDERTKRQALVNPSIEEPKRPRSLWSIAPPTDSDNENFSDGDGTSTAPRNQATNPALLEASVEEPKKSRSLWSIIDPTYSDIEQNVESRGDGTSTTPYSFL